MTHDIPNLDEEHSAKIPALQMLTALGWRYMAPADCLAGRGGSNREVILRDELTAYLQTRRFEYKGKSYPLSTNAIDQIVRDLALPQLQEGFLAANENIYNKICLGVAVTEFVDGQKVAPTIPLIDWRELNFATPESVNRFVITEEMPIQCTGGAGTRRPDLVGFVNGLPMVVIEAKRPASGNPNKSMVDEGVSQTIRNQHSDEIPHLFAYSQLLLAISGFDGKYGTTGADATYWQVWRDEEFDDAMLSRYKNSVPAATDRDALFSWRDNGVRLRRHFDALWAAPMAVTDQDRLLVGLLERRRFLEFIRYFIIFDRKKGKVAARHPQVFGVKSMIERIRQRKPANEGAGRQGGVIWHTTGSGKSMAMVFLCKSLLLHPDLSQCRIIVVTDRVDLEKQLAKNFLHAGAFGSAIAIKEGERAKATTGRDLARRIGRGTERFIFTLIQKFHTATGYPECKNPSEDLIVLVDEGHRTQGGEANARMRTALPRAAFIAFTGTPLLKDDKTVNKFGAIIHAYTMQQAVRDKAVVPLLYEERQPALDINQQAIDDCFNAITGGLTDQQKADIKRRFANTDQVYKSDNRLYRVALDISSHFSEHIRKISPGLKGQLAADSKVSAIRYKQHLDALGKVTSAVIISPPDTRKNHKKVDDDPSLLPIVQQWYARTVGKEDPREYEKRIIEDFSTDGDPDILIVVDKLLTGFDEPRNAVLYIDKPMENHDIIQAIARVNRLHPEKQYGLLVDYRGILARLDTAIKSYQDLATRTQAGYDIDDIKGLYSDVSTEYKKLPALHQELWNIFKTVENRKDSEQFRQVLAPRMEPDPVAGDYADANQKVREDFYQALTAFGLCLKDALASRSFFEDGSVSEKRIAIYKDDLAFFVELRKRAKEDAQETVDFSIYEEQIRRLVDTHIQAVGIRDSGDKFIIDGSGVMEKPEEWNDEKARTEAAIIQSRVTKTIEHRLAYDPYAHKYFSELLREAIAKAASLFNRPREQYAIFKKLADDVEVMLVPGIPEALVKNPAARAFYGIFRLESACADMDADFLADEALAADSIVETAVAQNSLNPLGMEAEITKGLLPRLYKWLGVERAKEVIHQIIETTRYGIPPRPKEDNID